MKQQPVEGILDLKHQNFWIIAILNKCANAILEIKRWKH